MYGITHQDVLRNYGTIMRFWGSFSRLGRRMKCFHAFTWRVTKKARRYVANALGIEKK